jgi:hypothetical protein
MSGKSTIPGAASSRSTTSARVVGKTIGPMPKDHPFFPLVGRVASEWAQFEHALDLTIWALSGAPIKSAACLTSQIMGATPRLRAIILLGQADGLKNSIISRYEKLMRQSYDSGEKRNRVVHDPWYADTTESSSTGDSFQYKTMPYKGRTLGFMPVALKDIELLIDEIVSLRLNALTLHNEVCSAHTHRDKCPPQGVT